MRCCSEPSAGLPGMIPRRRRDPEDALLGLRSALELFANLRPVRAHEALAACLSASTGGPRAMLTSSSCVS